MVKMSSNGRGEIVGVRLRGERTAAHAGDTPHTRPTRDARHDGPDRHTEHTEAQAEPQNRWYRSINEPP